MNLNELGQLVDSNKQEINRLKEEIDNSVFKYATTIFEDGQRVIISDKNHYFYGKEYAIVLRRPYNCNILINSLWGVMLYVDCLPIKKNGEVAKIGLVSFPMIYLELKDNV
jgi:hypothetical protein